MSIEVSGAYSPDTVYGQLTMPFLEKTVKINAHTPCDKVDNGVQAFNKDNFYNNQSKLTVSIDEIREMKGIELNDDLKNDFFEIKTPEFPPEGISNFSASNYTSSSDIVSTALKNGYNTDQAIVIGNAKKAYDNTLRMGANMVQVLSTRSYQVS